MDKERREALEWFIQFAQMNIDELKPGDKAKFLAEYEEYLAPDVTEEKREKLKDQARKGAEKGYLPENFYTYPLKDFVHIETKHFSFWGEIKVLQGIVQNVFLKVAVPDYIIRDYDMSDYDMSDYLKPVGIYVLDSSCYLDVNANPMSIAFVPHAVILIDYLLIRLYTLLSGLPRTSIQKCLVCGKLFLNTSLRIKKYCSSRCLWRFNAQKRREADPEGYKAKQREIMRAKYLKKKAEEIDRPIDKIKIQKRRSKKQGD